MTETRQERWQRPLVVGGWMILGLLLASCDERALPTQPSRPAAGPQARRSTGPIAFVSERDGTAQIYLANEDGSDVTQLGVGGEPSWARDGRQIAFHAGSPWAVHVINVDGTGDRRVVDGKSPAWSPDGRMLVFESMFNASEIDVVALDGSNRRPLFDSQGYGSFGPTWSPDGERILFSVGTYVDFELGLWIMNTDGSHARQLGAGALIDAWSPAWSPDGSEIAFVTHSGIEVARADGSGRHLRVPGEGNLADPDWTPDGRLIYTQGPYPGPTRIFITDGGSERQLIPEATAPARPVYRDYQAVWLR